MQASLPVVTISAPSALCLEYGERSPLPAAFMKPPQAWELRAGAALMQQPHKSLFAQKRGAGSGMLGAFFKGIPAADMGCYESCLGCAIFLLHLCGHW